MVLFYTQVRALCTTVLHTHTFLGYPINLFLYSLSTQKILRIFCKALGSYLPTLTDKTKYFAQKKNRKRERERWRQTDGKKDKQRKEEQLDNKDTTVTVTEMEIKTSRESRADCSWQGITDPYMQSWCKLFNTCKPFHSDLGPGESSATTPTD